MAAKKSIPKDVKTEVLAIVAAFNEEHETAFQMTFRGRFAYLAKTEQASPNVFQQILAQKMGIPIERLMQQTAPSVTTKLGRLAYNGAMDNWGFAVFKYSREVYDANELWFPGAEELDGTITGALNAGMQLYN